MNADFSSRLGLAANVCLRSWILSHQHDSEPRSDALRREFFDGGPALSVDSRSDGFAVDQMHMMSLASRFLAGQFIPPITPPQEGNGSWEAPPRLLPRVNSTPSRI